MRTDLHVAVSHAWVTKAGLRNSCNCAYVPCKAQSNHLYGYNMTVQQALGVAHFRRADKALLHVRWYCMTQQGI